MKSYKLTSALKEAADEALGERRIVRNEDWFDEDRKEAVRPKNEARKQMIKKETSSNYARYQELRADVNKMYHKNKREAF